MPILDYEQVLKQSTAVCQLCKNTPVPANFGSPRLCAFDHSGVFTHHNWNCVTAIKLRQLAGEWDYDVAYKSGESFYTYRDDRSYASMFVPPHPSDPEHEGFFRGGGFIAMTWYKHRGQTEIMIRVDGRDGGGYSESGLPLTLQEAEAAIENVTIYKKELQLK